MRLVLVGCVGMWAMGCAVGRPLDVASDDARDGVHYYTDIANDVSARCVSCHSDYPAVHDLVLFRDDTPQAGRNYDAIRAYAMAGDGGETLIFHHHGGGYFDAEMIDRWQAWIAEGAPR